LLFRSGPNALGDLALAGRNLDSHCSSVEDAPLSCSLRSSAGTGEVKKLFGRVTVGYPIFQDAKHLPG
jgi:hypothetical protein